MDDLRGLPDDVALGLGEEGEADEELAGEEGGGRGRPGVEGPAAALVLLRMMMSRPCRGRGRGWSCRRRAGVGGVGVEEEDVEDGADEGDGAEAEGRGRPRGRRYACREEGEGALDGDVDGLGEGVDEDERTVVWATNSSWRRGWRRPGRGRRG